MIEFLALFWLSGSDISKTEYVNKPGTILKLEASVSYKNSIGETITNTATSDLVIVSPVYRDKPVYASKSNPLLNGMKRKVLLNNPSGAYMGVDAVGIQLANGDLYIDEKTIVPKA